MKNLFFSSNMQDILLNPSSWQIVSSAFSSDVVPDNASKCNDWIRNHYHNHAHQEVLIALEGSGHYGFMNDVYPCEPGTVFLFNNQEMHQLNYYPGGQEMTHLWLVILGDRITARFLKLRSGTLQKPFAAPTAFIFSKGAALLCDVWMEMCKQHSLPDKLIRARIVSALGCVVSELVQSGFESGPIDVTDQELLRKKIITTVCAHIDETFGRGVSVQSLADIAGLSRSYFSKIFFKDVGCTVHDYINRCRILKARSMLDEGLTKQAVSECLGFSAPPAFARWERTHLHR